MRLAPHTVVALLLVSAPAFAQEPATTYTPPPCTCIGQPGPQGPPGPAGPRGPEGPPGPQVLPPTPWTLRPYDLTLPAALITLRGTVPVPGGHFVMIYSAPLKAAALIDPRTGLAQIIPIDPKFHGNVVADGFRAITPTFFEWTAGNTTWGEPWRSDWPWTPMPGWTWR